MTAGLSTTTRPLQLLLVADDVADDDTARSLLSGRVEGAVLPSGSPLRAVLRAAGAADLTVVAADGTRAALLVRLLNATGRRTVRLDEVAEQSLAVLAHRPGAGLEPTVGVSVVTTVLNEAGQVDALVDVLAPQLLPGDELIVVDGGSTDGTLQRLQARAAGLPALSVLSRPGTNISAGRNQGIAVAANAVIACTDAGCTPGADWLLGLRVAFAEEPAPGLVASIPLIEGATALQRAQALACYPHPGDDERPTLLVRLWGRLFGQVFRPSLPYGRSMAFTKQAWAAAGGFPEDLGWAEDGVFGLRVAEHAAVVATRDAPLSWAQRGNLRGTAKMYYRYGIGYAQSRNVGLMLRDAARVLAYVGAVGLVALLGWLGAALVLIGAVAYYSLPAVRVARARAGWRVLALVPFAMAVKDFGKVAGQLTGHARHAAGRMRRRTARP